MSSVTPPPPVKLTWSGSATVKPAVKHFNMPSFNGVTPSGASPNLTIASPTRAFNLNRSPRSPKILISSPATSPTTSRSVTPTYMSFTPIAENSQRRTIEIEAGVESSVVVREEVERVERHKEEEEERARELRERLRREQETSDALAAIECLLPGLDSAPIMARESPASAALFSAPVAPTPAPAPKADDALLRQQRELEAQREQLRREQAEWEEMKRAQQAKDQQARELDHHRERLQREQQEREQLQRELDAQKAQLQREKEQWERQKKEMQGREEAELREKEARERELKEQLRREKEQLEKEHQQLKLMREKEITLEQRKEEEKANKEQQVRKEQELKEKLQKEKEQIEREHRQMMERRENEQKRAQELKETQLREQQQLNERKVLHLQQQQQQQQHHQQQQKQSSQIAGHDDENVKNEDLSQEALIQRFIRVMEGIKATTAGGDLTYQGETAVKAVVLARDISLRVDKHLDDQAAAMPAELDDDTFSSLSTSMDDIRDELLFVATTTARFIAGWRVRVVCRVSCVVRRASCVVR